MTEEKVTIAILLYLENNGWEVVTYDYPQSGTGRVIHPNIGVREDTKNKGAIIPDIIAVRNGNAVYFENKNRFYALDFDKVEMLKTNNPYSIGMYDLLENKGVQSIEFGIGVPCIQRVVEQCSNKLKSVDFLIGVKPDRTIVRLHDPFSIF